MIYIVDRIEGEYAVCEAEDRSIVKIHICSLPVGIKEGFRISFADGIYSILPKKEDRSKHIQSLVDKLWN